MQTTPEEALIDMLRKLPPAADNQLGELAPAGNVEWSDCWTEEDIEVASRAAIRGVEQFEREPRSNREALSSPRLPARKRLRYALTLFRPAPRITVADQMRFRESLPVRSRGARPQQTANRPGSGYCL